ncbi:hypothetical protein KC19_3G037400 [Ceratodon purpureus]|nr:hypothetical protein KC19_3G037400 [Ceratodon purpureus]
MLNSVSSKCQDAKSQMDSAKLIASASMQVLCDLLDSAKNLSWAGAALAMVAYTLRRLDRVSQNNITCHTLLRSMSSLAKHIRALVPELKEHDQKLRDATFLIARGVTLCSVHWRRGVLSKFGFADTTMGDLDQLCQEIRDVYPDLNLAVAVSIHKNQKILMRQMSHPLSPFTPAYPSNKVGLDIRVEEVIKKLTLESSDVRAVVLHGLPGIGKSTLGDAVYAKLNFPGRTHCRIEVGENPSAEKICSLQASILERLSGDKVKLGYPLEGRQRLEKYLEECRESLFIYIDNVLNPNDLQDLLPEKLVLPPKSRILVTSRVANLCSELDDRGVVSELYEVEELDFAQAKQMFCLLVFEDEDPPPVKKVQVSQVLKACGGMPLALELVGKYLRRQRSRQNWDTAWTHTLVSLQSSDPLAGTKDMSSYLGKLESMYEQLSKPLQRAFLDIITYYLDLPWEMVNHVIGEDQLLALQELAFVKKSSLDVDGIDRVHVHDLLVSLGRKLESGLRISSSEEDQLPTLLKSDDRDKKPIEGLCLRNCMEELSVESLDSLSASLRILILEQNVAGRCRKVPAHLQLFITQGSMPFQHIEKLTELAVLKLCEVDMDFDFVQFPDQLKSLIINDCQTLKELPEWFIELRILSSLDLSFCKNLQRLPDDFGRLTALQSLELQDCKTLEELPVDLINLTALQRLNLGGCENLKSLPAKFGQLSMLQRLKLWRCGRLASLPSDFGELQSLQELNMSLCESLERLPENFGHLFNLQSLELRFCRMLKALPEDFVHLSALQRLDLTGCEMLVTLPEGIGQLTGLWELHLDECESLKKLPEGFGGLVALHTLSLAGCCSLSALSEDFGSLESLLMLKLTDCSSLTSLPESFKQLVALKSLDVAGASDELITSVGELVSSSCNINIVPEPSSGRWQVSDMTWQTYLQEPNGPRWLMIDGYDFDDHDFQS